MTTSPELAATLIRPEVEALADELRRRAPHVTAILQEASSAGYPWSAFLTLLEPGNENPLVIEVSIHTQNDVETLAADMVHEDGTIVFPSLVRRISPTTTKAERMGAIRQFVEALRVLIPRLIEEAVQDFPTVKVAKPESQVMMGRRDADVLEPSERWQFESRAREAMSQVVGVALNPGRASISQGRSLPFALVSDDQRIVGDIRIDTSGRLAGPTITDHIWKLQQVKRARRRLLVVGPERSSLVRWLKRYGSESARPVELWAMTNSFPEELSG